MTAQALMPIYEDVLRCTKCFEHRPCVVRPDLPPRGWGGKFEPDQARTFVFVAANPGHPLKMQRGRGTSVEIQAWAEAGLLDEASRFRRPPHRDSAAARLVSDFCTATYVNSETRAGHCQYVNGNELRFHRRCLYLARRCVQRVGLDPIAWMDHVWFTDLVKCSTSVDREREIDACVAACSGYLRAELAALRPVVIVALTRFVERTLAMIPPIADRVVYARAFRTGLRHPSDEPFLARIEEIFARAQTEAG